MANQIRDIINQLEKQKVAIDRALSALRGVEEEGGGSATANESSPAPRKRGRPARKRTLSAEARERIAAAQRKRWAAQKKAAKK
jgi:hypothetical protein